MPAELLLLLGAVKAGLLTAIALAAAACIPRASAATRHALLLAGMIGALLLPPLGATLPTFSPFSFAEGADGASPARARWIDDLTLLVLARSDAGFAPVPRSSLRYSAERWGGWLVTIWAAGSILAASRIASDLAAARKARSLATPRGRTATGIPVLESAEIDMPAATGLLRPAIMVPSGAALRRSDLDLVIAHEVAHVERRDCLTQLLVRLTCAVYWFDPLVWLAARRIALERERACDDRVLACGADPVGYSSLLIEMARRVAGAATPLRGAPAMARAAQLEGRIVRILDARAPRRGPSSGGRAAIALVACVLVAPLSALGLSDGPTLADASDPYVHPWSERVAGARSRVPDSPQGDPSTSDGRLLAALRAAAEREPEAPGDLVPDRSRWALSLARGGSLVEPLIEALSDPDWRVRGYAAWALGVSGDPRAVDGLTPLLEEPVWRLRAAAASALARIGDPRAADDLAARLGDPAWQVRAEAAAFLGSLRDPRFEDRIENLRNDPHIAVRLAAAGAFAGTP